MLSSNADSSSRSGRSRLTSSLIAVAGRSLAAGWEAPDKATPSSGRLITSAGHSRSSSSYSGLATVADVESREEPGVGLELVISGASMLKEGTGMLESFFASDAAALACAAGTFA